MAKSLALLEIEPLILTIRDQKVILDSDLADLYGVSTKRLNEQVKRNEARFPQDFMFQLTEAEQESLRSQIATSKGRGGRRYKPFAFTEHGALMAASVLNTPRAVEVSVFVIRAFVKLRAWALAHKEITKKLLDLEAKIGEHDQAIQSLVAAIKQLMNPPTEPKQKGRIGFLTQ